MKFLEVLGIYVVNIISTYVIRSYVVNKNKGDFQKIASKYNFPDDFCEYMENNIDKKLLWFDYIPVLNIFLALKDLIIRKKEMQLLEEEVKCFESDFGSISDLDLSVLEEEKNEELKMREYFVGYYLDGRPIVIYFLYDGYDNIVINDECAPSFNTLDSQQKVDKLMRILYEIYIGSKEYICCYRINEVFTNNMVKNLLDTFERDNLTYAIEKKLVRNKSK